MSKILIIDDDLVFRKFVSRVASVLGHTALEAENGVEGLSVAAHEVPDLIICDIVMPVMDGLEATRRIRKEFPQIKVLVLTQYDDKEYVVPVIEAGASGFISKTAASSELVSGIRSV